MSNNVIQTPLYSNILVSQSITKYNEIPNQQKGGIMLKEKTVKTLVKFAGPLAECGVISNEELDYLKSINQQVKPPVEIQDLLTLQETARILKITVKTVYEHINKGELELVKLGHRTSRITVKSLQEFIQKSKRYPNNL